MSGQTITINIDGEDIDCQKDETVLDAALNAGIYIPTLCYHPDLPSYGACGLCAVEIEGNDEPVLACITNVEQGMKVITSSPDLKKIRQEKIVHILTSHPHACLVCAEKEGCAREPCSLNVPMVERCCEKLGDCELERVAEYIGIPEGTPRYKSRGFSKFGDNPFIVRDYNLCIGCGRCVRACADLRGIKVLGDSPDPPELIDPSVFPEKLMDSGCQFCGICVEVCPTGALMSNMDKFKGQTPCQESCPAHIDIPRFLRYIAEGNFSEALNTMYQSVPFPGTLGYVCYYPCESECRRAELDDAVSIRVLKRLAFEHVDKLKMGKAKKSTGRRVAIVGSGPAGLSCAFYLIQWGHNVTVFEAKNKPGGMLRYGIPTFRLPRDILEKEIEIIQQIGVDIKVNTPVSSVEELLKQGFDAVFVGIGAQKGSKMGIDGEENFGVLDALQFLSNVYGEMSSDIDISKDKITLGQNVAVIGGGNTAIDAARTAIRLGAKAMLFYRRSEAEMPAFPEEVEEAKKEGVELHLLSAPVAVYPDKNRLKVEFVKIKLGSKDESGRPRPVPIDNSNFFLEFDNVITAIGQQIDLIEGIKTNSKGWSEYNEDTLSIRNGVYVGGDVVGPSSVVESVAMGRKAAVQIHLYLGGLEEETLPLRQKPKAIVNSQDDFLKKRIVVSTLESNKRLKNFAEIELSLKKDEGVREAARCLQCDLCLYLSQLPEPPLDMLSFIAENVETVPENAGVYTLFDENKKIIEIKGTDNLKQTLMEKIESNDKIKYFKFEEDPMYSKRESELLQQHIQQHGMMPTGGDELDELF